MDELISKRIEKVNKKLDGLMDDLEVLIRAQFCDAEHSGTGYNALSDLKDARAYMKKAAYSLAVAVATAEGDEAIGQMRADLVNFQRANEEGGM